MDEEATNRPAISVHHMREEETRAVRSLAGHTFSRPESAFFSPPPQTLVAERDGKLVGAIVPKVVALPDKHRCGAIFWLMTTSEARGSGVGGRLVEATLEYFEEHGLPRDVCLRRGLQHLLEQPLRRTRFHRPLPQRAA
jgi:GNAT superfamily N-acetyltransferase